MKNLISKIPVVLKLGMETNISKFITKMQGIQSMMLGNPNFPTAQPLMAQFLADINALVTAQNKALTKIKGSAAARNAQKLVVFNEADVLRGIVQSVVNLPANANNELAIAQSAGMDIKGRTNKMKGELTVKHGKVSGSVTLTARAAGKRASYKWEQSTDGINWVKCSSDITTEARNEIDGLIPGTYYFFHFQPVLPLKAKKNASAKNSAQGQGNWSQPVKIMVV